MSNRFGSLIRIGRESHGLSQVDLVRRLGYANLSKGIRRLSTLEEHGRASPNFLRKIVANLGLEMATLKTAYQQDQWDRAEAYEDWLDEPVIPTLSTFSVVEIFLPIPEKFQVPLHGIVSVYPALEAYALEEAKKGIWSQTLWLRLNRRWHVSITGPRAEEMIIRRSSARWDKPEPRLGTFLREGRGSPLAFQVE